MMRALLPLFLLGCDAEDPTQMPPPPGATAVIQSRVVGSAVVAQGALFMGSTELQAWRTSYLTGRVTPLCWMQYQTNAVSVGNTSSTCPTCEFGFALTSTAPVDLLAQSGRGPSRCGPLQISTPDILALDPGTGLLDISTAGSVSLYTTAYSYTPPAGFTNDNLRWVVQNPPYYIY
jgi:hypothetical protein